MTKSELLMIACGGCGCRQVSELLKLDLRTTGIYFNTNMDEMKNLERFEITRNCFHIVNSDGTGKSRELAEKYIKQEAPKFAEMISKYTNQDVIYFVGSMSGGTGSTAITLLPKIVKRLYPKKSLNIIATFPSISESQRDLENCIDCWNELIQLKNKGILDSIQFIDNNKLSNEDEINKVAMKELNDSFEIIGGKIDSSDAKIAHCSKGYKVILKLDETKKDTKEAIDEAMKNSMFYMPDDFECDVMIGNINCNNFDINIVRNEFEAYDFSKFNTNEDYDNIIVLGGCPLPKEPIELVKEALKELKNKKKNRVIQDDLIVKRSKQSEEEIETSNKETKNRLSSKDLSSMFADDDFWND